MNSVIHFTSRMNKKIYELNKYNFKFLTINQITKKKKTDDFVKKFIWKLGSGVKVLHEIF